MTSSKRLGRMIGAIFLVQIVGGIAVNFFLTAPLFGGEGFVVTASKFSTQIGLSALIGIILSGLSLAVAISAFPVFREHSQTLALWFIGLSVANLGLAGVEQQNVMSMVSFSQAYSEAAPAGRETLEAVRGVVASSRNWAHYTGLIFSGSMLFVFYLILFRFALIPRVLGAAGLASVALQLTAVSMPFFGYSVVLFMIAPLGLTQVAVSLWLIAKGFRATNLGDQEPST